MLLNCEQSQLPPSSPSALLSLCQSPQLPNLSRRQFNSPTQLKANQSKQNKENRGKRVRWGKLLGPFAVHTDVRRWCMCVLNCLLFFYHSCFKESIADLHEELYKVWCFVKKPLMLPIRSFPKLIPTLLKLPFQPSYFLSLAQYRWWLSRQHILCSPWHHSTANERKPFASLGRIMLIQCSVWDPSNRFSVELAMQNALYKPTKVTELP